jgi:hypothetical protein
MFRLLHLLASTAVALSIVGGIDAASSDTTTQSHGATFRRVGALLYVALYVFVVLAHLWAWSHSYQIHKHKKLVRNHFLFFCRQIFIDCFIFPSQLLIAISSTLPFLAVRVVFSVLNAFSHNIVFSSSSPPSGNTGSLSKFNLVTGEWWIYLVMSLLMEYITVLIYSLTGTLIPRGEDQGGVDIEMRK